MASVALSHGNFDQSRLKYYYPLQRYDQKSHLPYISKRGVELFFFIVGHLGKLLIGWVRITGITLNAL